MIRRRDKEKRISCPCCSPQRGIECSTTERRERSPRPTHTHTRTHTHAHEHTGHSSVHEAKKRLASNTASQGEEKGRSRETAASSFHYLPDTSPCASSYGFHCCNVCACLCIRVCVCVCVCCFVFPLVAPLSLHASSFLCRVIPTAVGTATPLADFTTVVFASLSIPFPHRWTLVE